MELPKVKLELTVNEVQAFLALLFVLDEAGDAVGISKDEGVVSGIGEKLIQGVLDTGSEEVKSILLPKGFEVEMWRRDGKIH
tara:strand:- start:413 stop:658 length:246 start_codon:yes stop_codon:yes gene_type:complete